MFTLVQWFIQSCRAHLATQTNWTRGFVGFLTQKYTPLEYVALYDTYPLWICCYISTQNRQSKISQQFSLFRQDSNLPTRQHSKPFHFRPVQQRRSASSDELGLFRAGLLTTAGFRRRLPLPPLVSIPGCQLRHATLVWQQSLRTTLLVPYL